MKWISSLAVVAAVGFALALAAAPSGCASYCASNCPQTEVYIGDLDNYELAGIVTGFAMNGPACPSVAGCRGDQDATTVCTHFGFMASQPGTCDFYVTFSDRPTEVVHLTFGETQNSGGSCCGGYPVVGPSVYVIPDLPSGGLIYPATGTDGGASNVGLYSADGGSGDATTPDAADAGADALPSD